MQAVLASEFPVDAASVERAHRPNQRDGGGSKGVRGEGGSKFPMTGLRALSTMGSSDVIKSSGSCPVSAVFIGNPEVEKQVTLCLGWLAIDCRKKACLSG